MWTLTVAVGNIPWALMFKTREAANDSFAVVTAYQDADIEDDFGQRLRVRAGSVLGAVLEDMDKSKIAHIERALHHARMQHEGQKMAQADATLRMGQAGPAILTPGFGNGGFPRQ